MKKPDIFAKVAALIVVVAGSSGVGIACLSRSFELLTASATFAGAGLYLLFGMIPPASSSDRR